MSTDVPQSIYEFLFKDMTDSAPECRRLDEIHLLDGTVIMAKDFAYPFKEMFLYRNDAKRKTCYAPYSAILKIVTSDKA